MVKFFSDAYRHRGRNRPRSAPPRSLRSGSRSSGATQGILITLLLIAAAPAQAQDSVSLLAPMIADISQDTVEIHSSFNGAQLLIFGARNQPGDLVLVVRGPKQDMVLRRKERIAGMWMNVDQEKYPNLPMFYAYAASRPLERIAPAATLASLGIGSDEVISLSNRKSDPLFDKALTADLARYRLWQLPFAPITWFGESLFKAKINLPDRLPRGKFTMEAYLFNRGQLVSFQTIPLTTYKTGFDAAIHDHAQKDPWLYGLIAIVMALSGGWIAHRLFNRRT